MNDSWIFDVEKKRLNKIVIDIASIQFLKMMKGKYIPALSFDFLTGYYDWIISKVMPKGFRDILVKQIDPDFQERILDFGTGTSEVAILLKKKTPTIDMWGIDIDEKVLNLARKKIVKENLGIQIIKYDGYVFPFPDNYFDKVVSCLVFHHLSPIQKQNALIEIFRVLKTNGRIHIADWGKERNRIKAKLLILYKYFRTLKNIVDHGKGLFPEYIVKAGFSNLVELNFIKTRSGTLCYYQANKS